MLIRKAIINRQRPSFSGFSVDKLQAKMKLIHDPIIFGDQLEIKLY